VVAVGLVGWLGCAAQVESLWVEMPPSDAAMLATEPATQPASEELPDLEQLELDERREALLRALDRHPGYQRCVALGARIYSTTVPVRGTLVNDESGDAAKLLLDPMPGQAILRACLVEALASESFAPTPTPLRVTRELEFAWYSREQITAMLAELASEPALMTDPGESSCPADRSERCEAMSFDQIMQNAVYAPDASAEDIEWAKDARVPELLEVTLHFCVEPNGRTSRIRRSHPGPSQVIVGRLIAAVSRWRFYPVERGGKPILACSHVDFSLAFPRPVEPELGPPMAPLHFLAAEAIYTPVPHWRDIRRLRLSVLMRRFERMYPGYRVRKWKGINITTFCVNANGRVKDVRTRVKYPGSPELDALLRETIKQWRYKPLILGGQPREFCTQQTFEIVFELR
jgi:TonB family protein